MERPRPAPGGKAGPRDFQDGREDPRPPVPAGDLVRRRQHRKLRGHRPGERHVTHNHQTEKGWRPGRRGGHSGQKRTDLTGFHET